MSNNLIRYNNSMNTVPFGKFKEKELDLFFSICFKLKEQETKELVLNFSELKELSHYENRNLDRFVKDLKSTYDKMLALNFTIGCSSNFTKFVLFTKYNINSSLRIVSIKVNEEFRYILNELTGNYTKFELMDFVTLKSGYSKNVFKLLKQWEQVGKYEITIEEFRRILDIPIKYRMSEIDKKVLKPVMEELPQHFLNLNLQKIKKGRNVSSLLFTWAKGIVILNDEKVKTKNKINIEYGEQISMFAEEKKIKKTVESPKSKEEIRETLEGYLKESSLKKDSSIHDEEREEDNTKDKFPPNDFLNLCEENNEINYIPLEECSPEMKKLSKKIEKEQKENEKLNDFSKEITLAITQLKKEIASASLFFKRILQTELADFEKKSQEWHWLFTGLDYNTLSLDHLKQFNELTKFFENKLGLSISETALEKCVSHVQESPINREGKELDSTALKNLISIKDIPEEKLLSKSGKNLVGGALISRLKKIAKELKKDIQLEGGKIILAY